MIYFVLENLTRNRCLLRDARRSDFYDLVLLLLDWVDKQNPARTVCYCSRQNTWRTAALVPLRR